MITALEAKELLDNGILPVVIVPSQNNYSAFIVNNNTKSTPSIISLSGYNIIYITGYYMDIADENTISQFITNQPEAVFYVNEAGELTAHSSANNGGGLEE